MNDRIKRTLKIMFGIGVPLGIVLLIIQKGLHIEETVFLQHYFVIGAGLVIVAVAVNVIYNVSMQKKIFALSKSILDGIDGEESIEKLKRMSQKCKSNLCKSMIYMNLSVAYSDMGNLQEALKTLEEVNLGGLPKQLKAIYYLDQAYYHFRLGNTQVACQITDQQRGLIEKFTIDPHLKFAICLNTCYYLKAKNEDEKAAEILKEAKKFVSSGHEEREYALAEGDILG